jgi:amino acid adenylation domain-containing protein
MTKQFSMLFRHDSQTLEPRHHNVSIAERLLHLAKTAPKCITYFPIKPSKKKSLTNEVLCARASAIAEYLAERTLVNDRVILAFQDPLDFIPAFFGCCLAGVIPVPISPRNPLDTMIRIAKDCGATLGLSAEQREDFSDFTWLDSNHGESDEPFHRLAPSDAPALLQYTSGSTRTPQGVMVTHTGLCATIEDLARGANNNTQSVMVSWLPYYHDMGLVYGILTPLYCGFRAYLMPPEKFIAQPLLWLRTIAAVRGTHTAAPNFAYALCATRAKELVPETDLSSLRFALNGAEPVSCKAVRQFETAYAPFGLQSGVVIPGYGLAEATLKVTSGHYGEGMQSAYFDREQLAFGRVVPTADGVELAACGDSCVDTQVKIVDAKTCQPCATKVIGEIWVAGETVAKGYWQRPEESRQIFHARLANDNNAWLRTGDLGFIYNGALYVVGRLKDLIIVGGRNFYCQDLEASVSECHTAIRMGRVFATAIDSENGEGILIGAEVHATCNIKSATALLAHIRAVITAEHGVTPARIVILKRGSVLRTSSGKIRRLANRDALLRGELTVLADDQVTPEDSAILPEIVRLVPIAHTTPGSRLIDLGLDSLTAAQLTAVLQARYSVKIGLAHLLNVSAETLTHEINTQNTSQIIQSFTTKQYAIDEPFELSAMQQAYWIGQQPSVALGNVAAHIRVDFSVQHHQIDELTQRLSQLVARHSALRIEISAEGLATFSTKIYDPLLPLIDLRQLSETDQTESLAVIRQELSNSSHYPLTARFTRLSDETTLLHLRLSLLAGDQRSFALLVRELIEGVPVEPESVIVAACQQSVPVTHRKWWQREIPLIAAAPELPLTRKVTEVTNPCFSLSQHSLSAALSAQLAVCAQKIGVTLTSLCTAAFADVIRLWSATSEFSLNLTSSTRDIAHQRTIGNFTSNILVSLNQANPSIMACAQEIQYQLWDSLDKPWKNGVAIIREMSRINGSTTLMPVVLTSLLSGDQDDNLSTLNQLGTVVDISNPTPQVALHIILSWSEKNLVVMWEHVEQLFSAEVAKAMFASFIEVLTTIATTPAAVERKTIAQLPAEHALRRMMANRTDVERTPRRLEAPIVEQASQCPDAIAVQQGKSKISYRELIQQAKCIAGTLQQRGVERNQIVAVMVAPGADAVASMLGILLAGATYLPIDPTWPTTRIDQLLLEANACQVIIRTDDRELPVPVLVVDGALAYNVFKPVSDTQPDDAAYVIFTSGSTGRPKGVVVSHEAVANTIDDINQRFAVNAQDRSLCVSSLAFDLSVYDIFGLLAVGGTVVFPEQAKDPESIAHALSDGQITLWNSVPAVMELTLDITATHSSDLRLIILSGDWIAPALPEQLRRAFPAAQPVSLGGATEVSIWSVVHEITAKDSILASIPYGKPLSNQSCYVRAPDGRERPDGVAGELYIGGRGLALAYVGNEEETARRFVLDSNGQRLYRTGDLARWLPNGELELLSRLDDQVKVQGYRIELGEIEAAAMHCGCLTRAVASVVKRDKVTMILLYAIVADGCTGNTVAAIRHELKQRLPGYMQPHHIMLLDTLPLTANGKLDRARLPPPPEKTVVKKHDESLESIMLAAFTEVTGFSIDPMQGFFEAGATSIHIVRLRALLASRGIIVPELADFFVLTTIRELATYSINKTNQLIPQPKHKDIAGARAFRARARRRKETL